LCIGADAHTHTYAAPLLSGNIVLFVVCFK
jgi:hypothetical protein